MSGNEQKGTRIRCAPDTLPKIIACKNKELLATKRNVYLANRECFFECKMTGIKNPTIEYRLAIAEY